MSQTSPVSERLAERLADVIMMLEVPDAYNREYIAAVCRSILGGLTQTATVREALLPFAKAADGAATVHHPDDFLIWQEVTVGDLRRAQAALSDTSTSYESAPRAPKVRTSHHRNKEEAARLQKLVDERLAPSGSSPERSSK